jgi:hypothetical protein
MKKSCAIGCAVLLILAAAGVGWVMMKAPQWWQQGTKLVMDTMAEERRISAFEAAWVPPSPQPDAAWAPGEIGKWTLKQVEPVSGWPELNVTRAGQRAIYEQGARTIDVGVVPANDLERETLLTRLTYAAQEAGNTTTRKSIGNGTVTLNSNTGYSMTRRGNRTHMKSGDAHTRVWWVKDWLFFFRTQGEDAPEFPEEFLRGIAGEGKSEW